MNTSAFDQLIEVIQRLRDPIEGCPWDLKQTHQSLSKYLLEEAYELVEAINLDHKAAMKEELGDVFLQIMLHAQIASEQGHFDMQAIIEALSQKMIRRHPHVFRSQPQTTQKMTVQEVAQEWEKIKASEKEGQVDKPILSNIPKAMPALMKAYRMGQSCARAGFDWESPAQVKDKVLEEVEEVGQAIESGVQDHIEEELGDLLFAVAQYARKLGFDPEATLEKANQKFVRRIQAVASKAKQNNMTFESCSLDRLEAFWREVKADEKAP